VEALAAGLLVHVCALRVVLPGRPSPVLVSLLIEHLVKVTGDGVGHLAVVLVSGRILSFPPFLFPHTPASLLHWSPCPTSCPNFARARVRPGEPSRSTRRRSSQLRLCLCSVALGTCVGCGGVQAWLSQLNPSAGDDVVVAGVAAHAVGPHLAHALVQVIARVVL
jgi:hypothetical protein